MGANETEIKWVGPAGQLHNLSWVHFYSQGRRREWRVQGSQANPVFTGSHVEDLGLSRPKLSHINSVNDDVVVIRPPEVQTR